ncbi:sulfur carrier protein ThiS [Salipiger bermudensis]|uniref:Thiamine biosynthesis protein ThiS n=1 Tax=Salipiger bermudensis (strain DSM 26914 / JCM 13377 / KCTC 12554 / HTCC2601) TaxID=314265 RepID=Q0FHB4_SALBH|nr:sulfur carrier protein ThiS [Salipiger bermudensis]EAU43595.1 thiamine biosynthesis protein ThiS [Salipiger bermudensis HTCC2601]
MRIDLNGASIETRARTLQDLIEEHGFADAAVATAVNGSFIPRTARGTATLSEGARVEVLSPMQGG